MEGTALKITKATIKRINAHSHISKPGYCDAIHVIGEILCRSAVILGEPGCYEANDGSFLDPWVLSDGDREFVSSTTDGEWEKQIARGLSTRYPDWIQGTFTHGLNGVRIYEVNKLVKAILGYNA